MSGQGTVSVAAYVRRRGAVSEGVDGRDALIESAAVPARPVSGRTGTTVSSVTRWASVSCASESGARAARAMESRRTESTANVSVAGSAVALGEMAGFSVQPRRSARTAETAQGRAER